MIVTKKNDILEVKFTSKVNFKQHIMFSSDWHFDNSHCKRTLLAEHLKEAEDKKAPVICAGDALCLMQGKYDPRKSNSSLKPEHMKTYLDDIIEDTADFLSKYKLTYIFFEGNHESNIRERLGTDMLKRLVKELQHRGLNAYSFGYQGFIRFQFRVINATFSLLYATHHGNWGGVVSKGVQSVARYSSIFPQADIFHSGHTHDSWVVPDRRYWVNQIGNVVQKNQWHLKTPTYKDEFQGARGWAVEKIVKPKPLGCIFGKIKVNKTTGIELNFDLKVT